MFVVESSAFDKEFQPTILFIFDHLDLAFAQFQQPDPTVVYQTSPLFVAQAETVDRLGNSWS